MTAYGPITEDDQKRRARRMGGVMDFQGHQYHWGSGGMRNAPSIPYGSSVIGGAHNGPVMRSLVNRGVIQDQGLELPGFQSTKDPQRGGGTAPGLVLHSWSGDKLDNLYSLGCFAVAKKEWPQFRQDLLDYQKNNPGGAYLNVTPDGKAQVTSSPIYGADGSLYEAPKTAFTPPQAAAPAAAPSVPPILQSGYGRIPASDPVVSPDSSMTVASNSAPIGSPQPEETTSPTSETPKSISGVLGSALGAFGKSESDSNSGEAARNALAAGERANAIALASNPSVEMALAMMQRRRGAFA